MHLLLDPTAQLVVVAFSLLGSFGNLALYQVGKQGLEAIRQRFPRIRPEQRQRVKRLYDDYGGWMLLLSGIPVLGSMLTTVAGAFGVPDGLAKRVIMAQGGITGGWSVYVRDGKPKYCYNFVGLNHYFEEGEKAIPVGTHQARIEFDYDGGGLGRGGTVTLYIDGGKVGEGRVDQTEPFIFSADETCDVGVGDASAVSPDYTLETSRFNGEVNWVEIDIDEAAEDFDHLITEDERFRVAMGWQ